MKDKLRVGSRFLEDERYSGTLKGTRASISLLMACNDPGQGFRTAAGCTAFPHQPTFLQPIREPISGMMASASPGRAGETRLEAGSASACETNRDDGA